MVLDLEINLLPKKTLLEELSEKNDIIIFLEFTGIINPNINYNYFYKSFIYSWHYFSKYSFLIVIVYFIGLFAQYNIDLLYAYIYTINFFLQSLSLPYPIYQIVDRLNQAPINDTEINSLQKCLKYSKIFIFLTVPFILLYFIGKIIYPNERFLTIIFLTSTVLLLNVTCYLSICLLFITSDAENICEIIHQMKENHQTLTIEQYLINKQKIDILIKRNYYINYIVIFVAFINFLVLFILLVFSDKVIFFYEFSMPILFIKEFVFVTILLYFISTVNQNVDDLMKIFGDCNYIQHGKIEENFTRMIIYNDLNSNRISYYIFGRRITKRDVLLQFMAICLSSGITLLRNYIYNV